jgi:hypothetical protein
MPRCSGSLGKTLDLDLGPLDWTIAALLVPLGHRFGKSDALRVLLV